MLYNGKYIIVGIVVFIILFTLPFTLNIGSEAYESPTLAVPSEECIESAAFMKAEHMQLLNTWRDDALREGKREYVATNGKVWNISLQNTCMKCHADQENFCDTCHTANSVSPYCWDCHVSPKGNQ